jgi:hypothetical protein
MTSIKCNDLSINGSLIAVMRQLRQLSDTDLIVTVVCMRDIVHVVVTGVTVLLNDELLSVDNNPHLLVVLIDGQQTNSGVTLWHRFTDYHQWTQW